MDFNFILLFIDSALLQLPDFLGGEGRMALGSDDPMVKGLILTMFAVTGFGILLNVFNSAVRRKMVDQTKLKRIMKETKAWQKERMAAMRAKDTANIAIINPVVASIPLPTIGSSLPRAILPSPPRKSGSWRNAESIKRRIKLKSIFYSPIALIILSAASSIFPSPLRTCLTGEPVITAHAEIIPV